MHTALVETVCAPFPYPISCRVSLKRLDLVLVTVDDQGACNYPPLIAASVITSLHRSALHRRCAVPSRLNPYVNFDGNAREAMEYYQGVFGGSLNINTFGEYGDADAPGADGVMHAQLENDEGFTLMASDLPPGTTMNAGDNMTISLSGDDGAQLRDYWNKLSDGGQVTMPLEKQMWGDEFGMCVDRFGVRWMVNITPRHG